MIECRLCRTLTPHEGTKLCSRCWELEHRIRNDLELAIRIVAETLATRDNVLQIEREVLSKVPCSCSGICGEEGDKVEHQCNRCKRLEAIGKILFQRAIKCKALETINGSM